MAESKWERWAHAKGEQQVQGIASLPVTPEEAEKKTAERRSNLEAEQQEREAIAIATAQAQAEAEKLPEGGSPFKPNRKKMAVNWNERALYKGLASWSPRAIIEHMQRPLDPPEGLFSLKTGTKPSNVYNQYDAYEYEPGKITARKKGEKEWGVLDPDTGIISKDLPADVMDIAVDLASFRIPGKKYLSNPTYMGGLELGRQELGRWMYGMKPTDTEEAVSVGLATGAGALAPPMAKLAEKGLSKVLGFPEKAIATAGREEIKKSLDAAQRAGKVATGDLAKIEQRLEPELKARAENFAKELQAEVPVPAHAASPRELPSIEAAGKTAEEALKKAVTGEKGTIHFITDVIHPAWGVKAKYLKYVPEFVEIIRKWWGDEAIPRLGSEAMGQRDLYFGRKAVELGQEALNQRTVGMTKDLARWMMGDEAKLALTAAEKKVLEEAAAGAGTTIDREVFRRIVGRAVERAMPPELSAARAAVRKAAQNVKIAKGELAKPARGMLEKVGEKLGMWKTPSLMRSIAADLGSAAVGMAVGGPYAAGVAPLLRRYGARATTKGMAGIGNLMGRFNRDPRLMRSMMASGGPEFAKWLYSLMSVRNPTDDHHNK